MLEPVTPHFPQLPKQLLTPVARWLADAIRLAEKLSPSNWAVTDQGGGIRLTVGKPEVLTISPTHLRAIVVSDDVPLLLANHDGVDWDPEPPSLSPTLYSSIPGSVSCCFRAELLAELLPLLRGCHSAAIQAASATPVNPAAKLAHKQLLVTETSALIGAPLPKPRWVIEEDSPPTQPIARPRSPRR